MNEKPVVENSTEKCHHNEQEEGEGWWGIDSLFRWIGPDDVQGLVADGSVVIGDFILWNRVSETDSDIGNSVSHIFWQLRIRYQNL